MFAQETLGLTGNRLLAINNGAPDTRKWANAAHDPPQIAFAGLVGERKGVDVLLHALSALPSGLVWTAKIGGNGEVYAYREKADKAGLAHRVKFLGWLAEADVDTLLTQSQIFVLPSRAENQPMSIIEAMARALPAVSTNIGAIPELIKNGETGLVVPSADYMALSVALADLIQVPNLRKEMGRAARQHYLDNYSMQANARQFADLYHSCMK